MPKTIKEVTIRARRLPVAAEDRALYDAALCDPEGAAIAARTAIGETDEESFVVILLDVRNRPIAVTTAGKGSPDACPVDPRCVFRAAILMGASAVIVAHNHPSGNTASSSEDINLTKRLVKGGTVLGLPVLDHLILGHGRDFSSMRLALPELF